MGNIIGDLTGDGTVDWADIAEFDRSGSFGSSTGDPNYRADCDLNGDGVVDMADRQALRDLVQTPSAGIVAMSGGGPNHPIIVFGQRFAYDAYQTKANLLQRIQEEGHVYLGLDSGADPDAGEVTIVWWAVLL